MQTEVIVPGTNVIDQLADSILERTAPDLASLLALPVKGTVEIESGQMVPKDMQGVAMLAHWFHKSQVGGNSLQSIGDYVAVIAYGMELGLSAIHALAGIYIVNGRPSIYGHHAKGVCQRSPLCHKIRETESGEGDDYSVTVTCWRDGDAEDDPNTKYTFTWQDAVDTGLANGAVWRKYRKRMVRSKALAHALMDAFSDVLAGLDVEGYMDESDITPEPESGDMPGGRRQITERPAAAPVTRDHMDLEPKKAAATPTETPSKASAPQTVQTVAETTEAAEPQPTVAADAPDEVEQATAADAGLPGPATTPDNVTEAPDNGAAATDNVAPAESAEPSRLDQLRCAVRDACDGLSIEQVESVVGSFLRSKKPALKPDALDAMDDTRFGLLRKSLATSPESKLKRWAGIETETPAT